MLFAGAAEWQRQATEPKGHGARANIVRGDRMLKNEEARDIHSFAKT